MDRKHILSSFVMAAAFSVHVFSAQAQTTWLWPIKGQETGQGVICAPQQYVGEEFNFGNLIVAAPEGTDVLCPADGVVLNFGVGYEKSLHESVSFHAGSDNFDSMLGELEEAGELKDLPVPTRYVGGDIFIRLEDGRMIFISGLTGGIPMKTGMRVSKGEVIGRVGYAYHKIDRPHIILSVTGRTGRPDDPMAPFGIPTTFLEPEEMTTPEFLTEEQAVEDISVLMDAYRELFPSMDEIVTPAQFETFRTGALNAVRGGVSYPDFYDIVYSSSTSRLMHDSHIRLRTPNPKIDITAQKYVPNIIHGILGDTVFVRHASESYKQHVGKKIVSIDGIPSAEICRRSMDMVSGYDGCNRSVVDRLLLVKYWYLYGSVDRPRTTTVVLEDGTVIEDEWVRQEEAGVYYPQLEKSTAQYRRMAASASGKYSFEMLDDSTVLFRLGSFDLTDVDLVSIADSLARYQDVPNMIIDVRYNAGGEDAAVRKVASYFLNRPSVDTDSYRMVNDTVFSSLRYSVNYSDRAVFSGYERVDGRSGFYSYDDCGVIIPDTCVSYKGRLYILADETSNSAAALFPSILSRNHRAVTVGRETGSGYHYMTAYDYARIMLPNSKIMVQIPVVKCVLDETVNGRYPAGRGLLPDYEVPLTYEEVYTSPTDPVLSQALSLIARQSSRYGR